MTDFYKRLCDRTGFRLPVKQSALEGKLPGWLSTGEITKLMVDDDNVGIAVWLIAITVETLDYISANIRERFV